MKGEQLNVKELGCDFMVFSGHKIGALTGIGVLYGRRELLEMLVPDQLGGGMITSVSFSDYVPAGIPQRFEAGTPNIAGAVSFTADGVHPFDLGAMLDSLGIAVRTGHMCAQPYVKSFGVRSVVRISPAFYNTEEEILQCANVIRRMLPMLRRDVWKGSAS